MKPERTVDDGGGSRLEQPICEKTIRQKRVLARLLDFYGPCPLVGKIFRRYCRRVEQLAQEGRRRPKPETAAVKRLDRGRLSEHKVASVLKYLAERQLIQGFEQTAPATPAVDFTVVTASGKCVMIEVKSSPGAIRKHYKTYLSKGIGGHPINGRYSRKRLFQQVWRLVGS